VPAAEAHRGLSNEARDRIVKARESGALERRDLDAILASLDPARFETQLEQVVSELGAVPLRRDPVDHRTCFPHDLPGGGRISRRYLRQLDQFSPMTREDEVAAARRLEFALVRIDAAEFCPPAVRAARRLEHRILFNEFVERSLHHVVSEVYAYRTYSEPLDDLVQEGNAALLRAVEKFDWRKGVRLRTYLVWWIKQAVERHLAARKGAVRVPHHLQQKLRRLKRQGILPRGFDGNPSLDDVARAFAVDHEHASRLVQSSRASLSLDQPIDGEGERFRDPVAECWEPVDTQRDAVLRDRIGHLLDELDERERIVLRLRFGLDGERTHTLEEVGNELHLSRERSRQIQQAALGKLRERAGKTSLEDEI
jgi:RNA polymerase primary sigma factor